MDFVQWRSKLGLQQESFRIIDKKGYPVISLIYNQEIKLWTIIYDSEQRDIFHLNHKLGFIWLWKRYGVLDSIKKDPYCSPIKKELLGILSTILDAISYFTLADMDLDFKKELLDYVLRNLLRAYNGRFPSQTEMIIKKKIYIFAYLKYFNLFPEDIRQDFIGTIVYSLANLQNQIIEDSEKTPYPLTRETFVELHNILDRFDSIKNSESYEDVMDYVIRIAEVFLIGIKNT